jgi:hypothetical protein
LLQEHALRGNPATLKLAFCTSRLERTTVARFT